MSFEKFTVEELREMKEETYRAERLTADSYYALLHLMDSREKDERNHLFRVSSWENQLYYNPIQDAVALAHVAWEKARAALDTIGEAAKRAEEDGRA